MKRTKAGDPSGRVECVDAGFGGERLGGEFVASVRSGGGELRVRPEIGKGTKCFIKLEDGFWGGKYWQNRVFFNFTVKEGKADAGTASNNKGVFKARFNRASLEYDENRFTGTLEAAVLSSKTVKEGPYRFRLVGSRAGHVLFGRFYTYLRGEHTNTGYFVGDMGMNWWPDSNGPARKTCASRVTSCERIALSPRLSPIISIIRCMARCLPPW